MLFATALQGMCASDVFFTGGSEGPGMPNAQVLASEKPKRHKTPNLLLGSKMIKKPKSGERPEHLGLSKIPDLWRPGRPET